MPSFTRVRIVGPSMEPALSSGEWWIVRRDARLRPGDVALIVHPERTHARIVKRLAWRDAEGWWVVGDNLDHSEDSRHFGHVAEVNVVGRLAFRYRPLMRR